jgi:microcystin-dependent protein
MAEPFIGQISCFACSFSPRNWAYCNGQPLAISQWSALYAVIGTIYGGDGVQTFNLPNLQGQSPMHWGTGPNNFTTSIGELQGTEMVTLTTAQLPQHNHGVVAASLAAGGAAEQSPAPTGQSFLSLAGTPNGAYNRTPTVNTAFSPKAIPPVGGSGPHENRQPYLALNLCIAIDGVFPARN